MVDDLGSSDSLRVLVQWHIFSVGYLAFNLSVFDRSKIPHARKYMGFCVSLQLSAI